MLMQILQSKPTPSCSHVPFNCFAFYFIQRPQSISLPSTMARVAAWKSFWFAFHLWLSPAKCLMLQFLGSLLKSLGTESASRPDVPKYQSSLCLLLHGWLKSLMFDLSILWISHPPAQDSCSSSQHPGYPLNPLSFPHFLRKTWEQESHQWVLSPLSFLFLFLYQNLLSHDQLIDSSALQCQAVVVVHRNLNLLTRKDNDQYEVMQRPTEPHWASPLELQSIFWKQLSFWLWQHSWDSVSSFQDEILSPDEGSALCLQAASFQHFYLGIVHGIKLAFGFLVRFLGCCAIRWSGGGGKHRKLIKDRRKRLWEVIK